MFFCLLFWSFIPLKIVEVVLQIAVNNQNSKKKSEVCNFIATAIIILISVQPYF